jgi:mitochondrial fission protein ELM1
MKNIKDEIWILGDDRPGTLSQAVGLANELGFEYKIIDLTYSFFSSLPNCFLSSSLLRLSSQIKKNLRNFDYLPKIIISAGRRSAPIALSLKKESRNQTKIIQVMNPNLDFKKFDFVILPKHDGIAEEKFPNLVTTLGSLTKINKKIITEESEKFSSWFQNDGKTKIALLVGGSSKKTKFTKESAIKLARTSSAIAKNMDSTLFVLTSRRTDEELANAIKSNLKGNFRFLDWKEFADQNPYLAILGHADFFIISGDSVSMISECCSTGKSVYIFDEKNISSAKHQKFHQELITKNYAKKLTKNLTSLKNFSDKKLQETKRVAAIINKALRQ